MAEPFRAMKLCVMLNLAAVAAEAAGFAARARRYAAALGEVAAHACRRAAAFSVVAARACRCAAVFSAVAVRAYHHRDAVLGAIAVRACRRAAGIACPYACAACLCLVVLCHRAAYAE